LFQVGAQSSTARGIREQRAIFHEFVPQEFQMLTVSNLTSKPNDADAVRCNALTAIGISDLTSNGNDVTVRSRGISTGGLDPDSVHFEVEHLERRAN
jgi:hypothetical protein